MFTIDIRGKDGQNGLHGINGQHDGADGTEAGPATPGLNAGTAYLRFNKVANNKRAIRVTGTLNNQPYSRLFELSHSDFITIDASGGHGGRGGNGGNGAVGPKGKNGTDASSINVGTDGKDGGRGGDGANATSGQNGGNGGFVQVTVAEEDMDLLFMLEPI